ncbi:DegV domain-containing protein SAV1425 [Urinicoccus massiliensis]|uniref:DegV domain-containing protein SAV1425 n=1 Tax=Urinicoccus massiliensis TaxID=1723382 RepID=A0A8H2R1C0_9FIRM|nr:DegV family protein [Urinicoccus massiliensis]VFB16513.1 DegV domain-containing protein SAV1425 [Urinicoccus massiliensis]
MNSYCIVSDSCLDFSPEEMKAKGVELVPINTVMDEVEYGLNREKISLEDFFQKIKEGARPTTVAANPADYQDFFEKFLKAGKDLLYIAFSSGLSSSYANARLAIEDLKGTYPDWKIGLVDTRSASVIESLVLAMALREQAAGKTMDQVVDYLEEKIPYTKVEFIIDDLFHLERGGRISKTKAIFGTALKVVPILSMDLEGKLYLSESVRGRKKALGTILSHLKENIDPDLYDEVYVSYSSSGKEAASLKEAIEALGFKVHLYEMSLTIAAHTGPGCLVLAYGSKKKRD